MTRISKNLASLGVIGGLAFGLSLGTAASGQSATKIGSTARTTQIAQVELLMPMMDPARGRKLFASKGCVVCHSINHVGGTNAPSLDASTMPGPMNPFDFVAKMWRGAPAMIKMQKSEIGHQIKFTGQELADIIAFAHDAAEQKTFSEADIPENIKKHMEEE